MLILCLKSVYEINLKIYPARNGDSFLLRIGTMCILIDGGYINTYNNFISKDLEAIANDGEISTYVIVTHIDQDHISGVLKLFEEIKVNKTIKVDRVS